MLFFFIYLILVTNSYSDQTVEGQSTDVEIDLVDQSFKSKGRSEITYEDITVTGREIERDEENEIIIAKNDIGYTQGVHHLSADSLELDLDKKIAKVKRGRTKLNKFFLEAEDIEARFPDILIAKNAFVTTCSLSEPHFKIKAKEVHFYPDAKFIAYKGWIYVGRLKLFPVPIYASYVVDKREERAPLFPQITYDEAKGTMLIYGFNYNMLDEEKFLGIDSVSADILMNAEISEKRGLGLNKLKLNYSMLKDRNISGMIEIKDWVRAAKEVSSRDIGRLDTTFKSSTTKSEGSSYKFGTKHNFKTKDGFIYWKDAPIIGRANAHIEYRFENSDLTKDSSGNYLPTDSVRKFTQTNIDIKQKIWKMLEVEYRFKNIDSSSQTIQELLSVQDEKSANSVDENKYGVDTSLDNLIKITHQDSHLHKIEYERRRGRDLRPERGRSGKSKEDFRDLLAIELKPLKMNIEFERHNKDIWRSKFSSKSNYVSSEDIGESISLSLGEYRLGGGFLTSYQIEKIKKEEKSFKIAQGVEDSYTQADKDYRTRDDRVSEREYEDYISGSASISNNRLKFKRLEILPKYKLVARKYLESEDTLDSLSRYVDSIVHEVKLRTPIVVIDNANVISRSADIMLSLSPTFTGSIFQGDFPSEQVAALDTYSFGGDIRFDLGNSTTLYSGKFNRSYHAKEEYLKLQNLANRLEFKVEGKEILSANIDFEQKWKAKDTTPNLTLAHLYRVTIANVEAALNYVDVKSFERDLKTLVIEKEIDRNSIGFTFKILSFEGRYNFTNIRVFDVEKNTDTSNFSDNEFKVKLDRKSENTNVTLAALFKNQYDNIQQEFKDTEIGISYSYEDYSSVEREEKSTEVIEEKKEKRRFDLDDTFISSDEEIDRILEESLSKPAKDIMDLGREEKPARVARELKKISIEAKTVHDEKSMQELGGLSFGNYMSSWKRLYLSLFLKYSTYFELDYKISKKREDIKSDFTKNEHELKVKLGFGYKDYEWIPGFYYKQNLNNKEIDKIYGTLEHSMHCTTLSFKLGQSRDRSDRLVWMIGFELSINSLPEKSFGMDVRGENIENVKFGI